ncbi:MAG: B12-binding domain-containing protein, partial [Clostridia bacterium]|nr:B12-binding domain-containing protein [Clostridia bacterium]
MSILEDISAFLQRGRAPKVRELVEQALSEGIEPKQILEEGLLSAMSVVGEKFKKNEVFVPEVLVAARAMNVGVEVLRPHLVATGVTTKGTAVIGTVKG